MDDFLQEFDMSASEASTFEDPMKTQQQQQPPQQNNYQKQNSNGDWKSKGRDEFIRKQKEVQDPYLPVVVYIDRDFPENIKDNLIAFISKLISKGFTVRFNADDRVIYDKIISLSNNKVEAHVPFNDFKQNRDDAEGIKSKFCWNSATTDHIAQQNFVAWDKLPKIVRILMSRNVRMLIGSRNNSPAKFLITWSPDGATTGTQVSTNTGNVGTYIKTADSLSVPVLNLNNQESRELISKYILKGE